MATLLQTLYQTLRIQRKRRCCPCTLAALVDVRLEGRPTCLLTITVQSGKCYLRRRQREPSRGSNDGVGWRGAWKIRNFKPSQDSQAVVEKERQEGCSGSAQRAGLEGTSQGKGAGQEGARKRAEELENEKDKCCSG